MTTWRRWSTEVPLVSALLITVSTNNPKASPKKFDRAISELSVEGFAAICYYNGVLRSVVSFNLVWADLGCRRGVASVKVGTYAPPSLGRLSPLIKVAFETTRTGMDMIYAGVFRKRSNIAFGLADWGGTLRVLSGRLKFLGTNP